MTFSGTYNTEWIGGTVMQNNNIRGGYITYAPWKIEIWTFLKPQINATKIYYLCHENNGVNNNEWK